jgi:hypothetical protein
MAWGVGAAGLALVAYSALGLWHASRDSDDLPPPPQARAFRLSHAVIFAAVVAGVMLLSLWLQHLFGDTGAVVAASVAALAELHAATASLAQLAATGALAPTSARWGLLAALGASAISKSVVAFVSGGMAYGLRASLALAALGALAGGLGAAGIGAGLAAAEALARSHRGLCLVSCGAVAGLVVAGGADLVLRALVDGLVGSIELTGGSLAEGLSIGGTAGLGYALATRQPPGGGLAAPRGRRRATVAGIVAAVVAAGAAGLALAGGTLVGGLINEIAGSSPDAQLALAPLGRLLGEPDFGSVTRVLLSAFEGGAFGFALAWGLTARPRR